MEEVTDKGTGRIPGDGNGLRFDGGGGHGAGCVVGTRELYAPKG